MLAPYNFLPLYCPSCGTPTRLDRADNPLAGKFMAKEAVSCAICGITCQLSSTSDIVGIAIWFNSPFVWLRATSIY
jgi:phosphopantetheinyl transferase (holo-ACP synthase)